MTGNRVGEEARADLALAKVPLVVSEFMAAGGVGVLSSVSCVPANDSSTVFMQASPVPLSQSPSKETLK